MDSENGKKKEIKKITVALDGQDFTFHITLEQFSRMQREVSRSPGMAVTNFLLETSTDREGLQAQFKEDFTLATVLVEPIIEELGGARRAIVKK